MSRKTYPHPEPLKLRAAAVAYLAAWTAFAKEMARGEGKDEGSPWNCMDWQCAIGPVQAARRIAGVPDDESK